MFTQSIRWRMLIWQAFLLAGILAGFGVTAYQLHRTNRFSQIDDELARRVAAVAGEIRLRPPFGPPLGHMPFELGFKGPPPWHEEPEFPPLDEFGVESLGGHPMDMEGPPRWGGNPPNLDGDEFEKVWRDGPLAQREIRLSPRTLSLFGQAETNDFYYAVWSVTGTPLKRSTNTPAALAVPGGRDGPAALKWRTRGAYREAFQFSGIGECVLTGRAITADLAALRHFGWLLGAAGASVLTLGLGGSWLVAGRALRPVEAISAAASRISAGRLAERIDEAGMDSELGRLAAVLNSTFARLETAFAQQKQFTGDASHELRTPIAVIISEAQSTLARERSAAEYRETVETCLEVAQQMRKLTRSLLELARYDAGQETFERAPFDLAEQARACVELMLPLARARRLDLRCELTPLTVPGDAVRLGQVITNLLANAIYYNHEAGWVKVECRPERTMAVLSVSDSGQGIAARDLPHVFERFYRGDVSRSQSEGHSGLGLAICKAIVEAHGGTIEVASQPGAGSRFVVKLPV
jgi:two-component system, OmpR family, sensor kinase